MKLIGLTGKARSGKDTVAAFLKDYDGFQRVAFADPIKVSSLALFGLGPEYLELDGLKELPHPFWGISPRQMWQVLGTECMRENFGHDFWIRRAQLEIDVIKAFALNEEREAAIVITDVRFDDEARFIRQQGGVVLRVVRPHHDNGLADRSRHASERGVDDQLVNATVSNDGAKEVLYDRVVETLESLYRSGVNV